MVESINKLKEYISTSDNIVFFGGAGVSTESGIPDFRSEDGLYSQQFDYPPEQILSNSFFISHTEEFYKFYRLKMLPQEDIKPNFAHIYLVELERQGKLNTIITQNIDGLHQLAGSKKVLELHGSVWRNYCMNCGKFYENITDSQGVPVCICKGKIKPDVVLYEESLNSSTLDKSIHYISNADLLIIGGTSLNVYPAAGLVQYFKGNKLVIINKSPTQYDSIADLLIPYNIGTVFQELSRL